MVCPPDLGDRAFRLAELVAAVGELQQCNRGVTGEPARDLPGGPKQIERAILVPLSEPRGGTGALGT